MKALKMAKFARPIVKIGKNGMRFLSKNSNVVLTIIGATGTIATAVVAVYGTIKAVKLVEKKQVSGTKEIVKTVWKCYIPTIGIVILTTTAIICNGKINAKRLAVLTSAYSGTVEALKKVEEKMSDQIGPKKTQKAFDEADAAVAQENVPQNKKQVIATGHGNQLFYCRSTGQWFYSDRNGVEKAEMQCQKEIAEQKAAYGSGEYYPVSNAQEALGLDVSEMGEYMAWPLDQFSGNNTLRFYISSDWMDLPWGKEVVGIVRFDPWPENL